MQPVSPSELVPPPTPLSDDPRWKLTLQVAAAPCFKKSARLRDFLLYVCEKALSNQLCDIREQHIGKAVFGRRPEYDAGIDNIVRVEARELRKRLDTYFSTDGRDEPVVIRIPKGSYVPIFEPRSSATGPSLEHGNGEELAISGSSSPHRSEPFSRPAILVAALVFASLLLSTGWLLWQNHQLRQSFRNEVIPASSKEDSFWPLFLGSDRQTIVVLSDTCWVLLQDFWHRDRSLRDYLSRQYMEDLTTPEMRTVVARHFTDIADASILRGIVQSSYPYSQKLQVRSARALEIQDLKTQNLIFIGSRRSNPWVEQFDQQLPFTDEFDPQTGKPFYANRTPRAGEAARYVTKGKDGAWEETYGAVSYLANLGGSGNVLIIEGNVAEASEAVGDFVCDSSFLAQLRNHLKLSPKDPIPHFEMLLKISVLPGSPAKVEYLTHRVLPD
jgi:hypothetical protein